AAHTGFTAQHDRVRLLEDGISHVRDFGPGRHRVFDHRFEHVRGHDDGLPYPQTTLHDSPLDNRQFFHRAFDPEVPPRDHDRVGGVDHLVDLPYRRLVFDFRDDLSGATEFFHDTPEFLEIAFLARETECDEIDPDLHTKRNIFEIFFRERRQI